MRHKRLRCQTCKPYRPWWDDMELIAGGVLVAAVLVYLIASWVNSDYGGD